jgi:hypothetical protein
MHGIGNVPTAPQLLEGFAFKPLLLAVRAQLWWLLPPAAFLLLSWHQQHLFPAAAVPAVYSAAKDCSKINWCVLLVACDS